MSEQSVMSNSGRIEHHNERMNLLELTGHDIEACRRIHPVIHKSDKDGGEDTADGDDDARKKMKPARHSVPDPNSLFRNILGVSPYSSKILRVVRP
jgi:hypothetical protein